MTHYEVLGVGRSADTADIRRAYLELARASHPDLQPDARSRGRAEDEMRRINQAWSILGDPRRRRAYDVELDTAAGAARPPRRRGGPSPDFVPYVDDDTDYSALLDATPVDGTNVPRWLQLLPVVLLGFAVFAVSAGLAATFAPLIAFGVVSLVLSGLAFLATPALAVMRSRERDLE